MPVNIAGSSAFILSARLSRTSATPSVTVITTRSSLMPLSHTANWKTLERVSGRVETIAAAAPCAQHRRVPSAIEPGAQSGHMRLHHVGAGVVLQPPDRAEQRAARHELPGIAGAMDQQRIFARAQVVRVSIPGGGAVG